MDCSQAVLTLFLLVPCDPGGGHSGDAATHPDIDLIITEAPASPERIEDHQVGDCFILEREISALRNSADARPQPPVLAEGASGRTGRVACRFHRSRAP